MRIRITRATGVGGGNVAGVGDILSDLPDEAALRLVQMGKAVVVADDVVGTVEPAAPVPEHAAKRPKRTR